MADLGVLPARVLRWRATDFLTLAALAIQCVLIASRLESREEAKVILMFHVVGTLMEVFKTSVGSWVYPEASFLRIGGVPLFSGFMYASIGSYIARAWRLFDFRFTHHPPFVATVWLAIAIYINFFTHHFLPDARGIPVRGRGSSFWANVGLFPHPSRASAHAVAAWLCACSDIHLARGEHWHVYRCVALSRTTSCVEAWYRCRSWVRGCC